MGRGGDADGGGATRDGGGAARDGGGAARDGGGATADADGTAGGSRPDVDAPGYEARRGGASGDGAYRNAVELELEERRRRQVTAARRWPLPTWLSSAAAYCVAAVVVTGTAWLVIWLLLRVRVLTFSVIAALLFAALLLPITRFIVRRQTPRWVAALVSVVLLVALPGSVLFLIVRRAARELGNLQRQITEGLDQIRSFLVSPPLSLSPRRIDELRDTAVNAVISAVPSPRAGAMLGVELLAGFVIALFVTFFLLKDGPAMWRWVVSRTPTRHHHRIDGAGHCAWSTVTSYIRGTVLVALIDAVGIGAGLFALQVPLALSLAVITFFGAFIPLVGATVSGALAVLVTLVTVGAVEAAVVLALVLLIQQIEGNLLQPLILGAALQLHPVVILFAVTAGGLLAGIAGAVVAVPLVAVTYQVLDYLAGSRPAPDPPPAPTHDPPAGPVRAAP